MENILQAEKQIDAVYTHDDDMAQGVVQAIRNAGREDEMFLTGVGGSQDAMKQIEAGGLYRATFLYNPNMAATRRQHGAPDRARRGLPGARPAGGPAPGHRAGRGRHEGQRRRTTSSTPSTRTHRFMPSREPCGSRGGDSPWSRGTIDESGRTTALVARWRWSARRRPTPRQTAKRVARRRPDRHGVRGQARRRWRKIAERRLVAAARSEGLRAGRRAHARRKLTVKAHPRRRRRRVRRGRGHDR